MADLWMLYDKLNTHIRSLETLNITGAEYGVILTPLVLNRLPKIIRLDGARLGDGKESDLDALLSFLHSEIIGRKRSQTFQSVQISVKADHKTCGRHITASSLLTDGRNGTGKEEAKKGCGVCGKWHAMGKWYLWTKLDFNGRMTQCMEKGLCFLYLGPHRIKDCRSSTRSSGSGRNHPLLCSSTRHVNHVLDNSSPNEEITQAFLQYQWDGDITIPVQSSGPCSRLYKCLFVTMRT
ncbi:hypothetical protein RRG08_060453 [Elysia crispata]|uniref:Uncharacterized protein n=1 Tax=Elysia crispata TaxID=231223 RepID=A0AAE1AZP8_9GAST|nr:hypothetical protein RRG08_060453 [Elysia crispata]